MNRSDRPGLTDDEYERLRRAAPTPRADLVLRLGAEVGLRPAEMASLRPADVTSVARDGADHFLLDVGDRTAYLPPDVERDLRQYANANGVDPAAPLFDVSARRLQMLVEDVSERAADADPALADVSTADLRERFAARWLDDGVNPAAVLAASGWSRIETLAPYLEVEDRGALLDAFASAGDDPDAAGALDAAGAVADALVGADTTDEVRERVSDALASSDRYRWAWVEGPDGPPEELADEPARTADRLAAATPSLHARARTTGDVQTTTDAGPGTVAVAPVPRSEHPDETLVVAADSLSAGEPAVLGVVGALAGFALTAAFQRHRRLSDTALQASFAYEDTPLTRLSADLECSMTLAGTVPGESLLLFLDVAGVPPDRFLAAATDADGVADVRLVSDSGSSARFEVAVAHSSPLPALVEAGGTLVDASVDGGEAAVTLELPQHADVRALRNAGRAAVSSFSLESKREVERSARTLDSVRDHLDERLTDRQASTLRAAYLGGYFEWPRESTAERIAASLDVSSPTFHQHLRKGQQKLLDTYLDGTPRT
ncbi:MAG: bacterio-opsin activator domain-containing protein [Halobacterium sp.]